MTAHSEHLMNRDMWVELERAHEFVGKSRPTIYRWVQAGLVTTMQPLETVWVFLPSLWEVEKSMRRHGKKTSTPVDKE
jgi:hypothetical protein